MHAKAKTHNDKPLVLVTGSTGLIGSRVVAALRPDYRVVGMDVTEPDEIGEGCDWIYADLTDGGSTHEALQQVRARHGADLASVVHLAAYYDFAGEDSPLYEQLTVQGSARLANGMQEFDRVEQLIFSSSLLVMKPVATGERLTEESELRAEWQYPQSKIDAERVLEQRHGAVPLVILRLAGVYDETGNSLPLSRHIRRIFEKQPESLVFPGDKAHGQPFVHLDDVAGCIRATIDRRQQLGTSETFLVAEEEVMSHQELQQELGQLIHGRAWPTIRIPKPVAKAGAAVKDALTDEQQFIQPWMVDIADDNYPVELSRARERLSWEPRQRLRDVLPRIVDRLQRDPAAFYERHGMEAPVIEAPAPHDEQAASTRGAGS